MIGANFNKMPIVKIDQSQLEFFKYLEKFFKDIDPRIEPFVGYSKFEITLLRSTPNKKDSKVCGFIIKAE